MRPLPYTDLGAGVAFFGLLAVFVAGELVIRGRSILNREGERRDRGSFFGLVASIVGGVYGAFLLASTVPGATLPGGARWPAFVAGLVLIVAGLALRWWAVTELGRFFTVDVRVQSDQTVVDSGPYRWVRHPSYSGIVLVFVGIGLALTNGPALACAALVPLVGLVVRIRVEERALHDGLGDAYRRYASGRARLLPHVW